MVNENKKLIIEFFKSIKCEVVEKENSLLIKKIPEKIQKFLGIADNFEFVESNSDVVKKIKDYLKNNPSKTLLKIDLEFPKNIQEKISLRNCSISKIEKKNENNYFSKFTFLTTLRSLNHTEQEMSEIFVHEGKVVKGNLNDYNLQEGKIDEASTSHLAEDYKVARESLRELLNKKIEKISLELNSILEKEVNRVEQHYSQVLKELESGRNRILERIHYAEGNGDVEGLEKAKKLLDNLKNSNYEKELNKVLNEKKVVLDNERMKHSLDIDNKLINTTVIYYPVFKILVGLNESGFTKNLEILYNPLTDEISHFNCDACKTRLDQINVCRGGHICCSSCLHICNECGKRYCRLCFSGVCNTCGKLVCKNCSRNCSDCKKIYCKNCMRTIVGSIEKCKDCAVYCPICSKVVDKKSLIRGSDGRGICRSCYNSISSKVQSR